MVHGHSLGSNAQRSSAVPRRLAASETVARLLFLFAAAVSFVLSVTLWFTGHHQQAIFVGLWVPSILSLGGLMLARGGRR